MDSKDIHIICFVQGNHVLQTSRDITQITVDADITWNPFQHAKKQPHALVAPHATTIPTALLANCIGMPRGGNVSHG
jgi:hypothetical protein